MRRNRPRSERKEKLSKMQGFYRQPRVCCTRERISLYEESLLQGSEKASMTREERGGNDARKKKKNAPTEGGSYWINRIPEGKGKKELLTCFWSRRCWGEKDPRGKVGKEAQFEDKQKREGAVATFQEDEPTDLGKLSTEGTSFLLQKAQETTTRRRSGTGKGGRQ